MPEHREHTIAADIEAICEISTLTEYANTDGDFCLDCYRPAVVARGGPLSDDEWDAACEIIRERWSD